jgi:hypothetical protein
MEFLIWMSVKALPQSFVYVELAWTIGRLIVTELAVAIWVCF